MGRHNASMPSKEKAQHRDAAIEWSERFRSWCVYDVNLVVEVLKSSHFVAVDFAGEYEKIEQRTGIDYTHVRRALHHIPLANEGERHSQLRRDFAHVIRRRSAFAKEQVEQFVSETLPKVLQSGRTIELIRDVVRPTTDSLFAGLVGMRPPASDGPSPSQIFDRFLGLNRRKIVQNEVARLADSFSEKAHKLATSNEYATALTIVGYDSVVASLGSSLLHVLHNAAGRRLNEIAYPDTLPTSGVPYVERVAKNDLRIDGQDFHAGDRLRLFLDGIPNKAVSENVLFFGKGRHLCLGMDLSQWVWRTLVRELAGIPLELRIIEARLRRKDYVFNMYDSVKASVHG